MRLCINDARRRVKSYLSTVKYEGRPTSFYGQDMANCSLMFMMKALKRGQIPIYVLLKDMCHKTPCTPMMRRISNFPQRSYNSCQQHTNMLFYSVKTLIIRLQQVRYYISSTRYFDGGVQFLLLRVKSLKRSQSILKKITLLIP